MKELADAPTLRARMTELADKFAEKYVSHPPFTSWFLATQGRQGGRRAVEHYLEKLASFLLQEEAHGKSGLQNS